MISAFDAVNFAATAILIFVFGYTALRAMDIRGALAVRAYRNQALGIGLISAILALLIATNTASAYLVYHNPLETSANGGFGVFFVFLAILFYWVDASARAARRTDPLSRDTLHWRVARVPLWVGTAVAPIVVFPVDVYALFTTAGNPGPAPPWAAFILLPGILIPVTSGIVLLPILSRRTGDAALRMHFRWFGYFSALLLVLLFVAVLSNIVGAIIAYALALVGAYCLYKCVLYLAPLKQPTTVATWPGSYSSERERDFQS